MNSNIKSINQMGQHVWLDYFDRKIMDTGELNRLIIEDRIGGLTSNPSIFENAISGSSDYDDDIREFSESGPDQEKIFSKLVIKDIRRAADLFQPMFNQTNGQDGFVSLEVSPQLAKDTGGTVQQAKYLWEAVNRKNLMIKIPATVQGLPAIRKCISEGININITLLFSLSRYKKVIEAYMDGLEDRLAAGKPISEISSVASFFISRIDTIIDPLLTNRHLDSLKGDVAVSCAKKAYSIYIDMFHGERFKKLEAKGAKRQHLLWASTSTKDPSQSDVKYVEALIGPETINTMTPRTIIAFNHHGKTDSHLTDGLDHANSVLAELSNKGIDMEYVSRKLETDGIEAFNKAYEKLLKAIEQKIEKHHA